MGFNYERGQGEMLHSFAHRAEGTLQRQVADLWDRFDGQRHRYQQRHWLDVALPGPDHPEVDAGNAHCGNVHFPPNAFKHYQYDRKLAVQSDCADWAKYPALTGQKAALDSDSWGGTSDGFFRWWLGRFPRNAGGSPEAYGNWLRYVFPEATARRPG